MKCVSLRKRWAGRVDALHPWRWSRGVWRKAIVCMHGKTATKGGRKTRRKMGSAPVHGDCWGKDMMRQTRQKDSRKASRMWREARLWEGAVRWERRSRLQKTKGESKQESSSYCHVLLGHRGGQGDGKTCRENRCWWGTKAEGGFDGMKGPRKEPEKDWYMVKGLHRKCLEESPWGSYSRKVRLTHW